MILEASPYIENIDNEVVREPQHKYKTKINELREELLRMGEDEEVSKIEESLKRID
jgi:hypothetical protein